MNSQNSPATKDIGWVVEKFVTATIGVRYAVVLSADGLVVAANASLPGDQADRLAAVASGVYSLAIGTAEMFGLELYEQSILRFSGGHVFICALAKGAALAVVADAQAPMGVIAHQMVLFAERVGENLDPAARGGRPVAAR